MGTDIHTAVEVRTRIKLDSPVADAIGSILEDSSGHVKDLYNEVFGEPRYANGWVFAGKVFDSTRSFDYLPATREVFESFDDERLIDSLNFRVLNDKYGTLRQFLSHDIVEVFKRWEEWRNFDREQIKYFTAAYRESLESTLDWDYYANVQPFEWNIAAKRFEHFDGVFTPEQREELIAAAIKYYRNEETDIDPEEDYVDPTPISINQRKGEVFKTHEPFDDRNYNLFAALASIRNGHGFAGVYTGEPIIPVAEPRGLPEDADKETIESLSGEHTPSWLLLSELLNYDWDQPKISGGYISGAYYELLKENGEDLYPFDDELTRKADELGIDVSVSGGISGSGIRCFSEDEYLRWRENNELPSPNDTNSQGQLSVGLSSVVDHSSSESQTRPYVQVRWSRPLRESLGQSFWDGLNAMQELVPEGGTTGDVRLVFDFDS